MVQIKGAIAPVRISIERLLSVGATEVAPEVRFTDAMRVGVIGKYGVILREPVLHFGEKRVVFRVGAIVGLVDVRVKRSGDGILQVEQPPLLGV